MSAARTRALALLFGVGSIACAEPTIEPPSPSLRVGRMVAGEFVDFDTDPRLLLYSPSPPGIGPFDDADHEILAGWTFRVDPITNPELTRSGTLGFQDIHIDMTASVGELEFDIDVADGLTSVCCHGDPPPATDDAFHSTWSIYVVDGDRAGPDWAGLPARLSGAVVLASGERLEFDYTLTTLVQD